MNQSQENVVYLRRGKLMENEMFNSTVETTPLPRRGRGRPRKIVETKHDKFIRFAESRISRLLDTMRIIGNLNSVNFDFTPDEIEAICKVISTASDETVRKLRNQSPSSRRSRFKLSEVLGQNREE